MLVWLNGEYGEAETACVAVDDRGLLLGDGVFDTFRIEGGAPLHLDAHLARLRASAAVFGLPVAFADAEIEAAARALSERNAAPDAVGRLTITRGPGQRGLPPPDPAQPLTLLRIAPMIAPPAPRAPLRVLLSDVVRPSGALTSRHKTLSYIENVEARRRAALAGCDEALLLNERGEIACASAANVFWIARGQLHTPSLDCGVLPGVTRARLLQAAAAQGLEVRQRRCPLHALTAADAIFLTNSVAGLAPVAALVTPGGARRFDADNALLRTLAALL